MRTRNIQVGLFVIAGMLFTGLVIFLIGSERRLFESSSEFTAKFSDVQGLKGGAPIRMGGVDIGHVISVSYGEQPGDTTIYVQLSVVKAEAGRIKADSVVKVAAKGLLGDKMIEITTGHQRRQRATSATCSGRARSFSDFLAKLDGMSDKRRRGSGRT